MLDRKLLGKILKDRRKQLKLSRDDLAELAGVSRNFIVKVENTKGDILVEKLTKIITPLGFELSLRDGNGGIVIEGDLILE